MNDYLTKPISPRALAEAIARWLPGKVGVCDTASHPEDKPKALEGCIFDAEAMLARFAGDLEIAGIAVAGTLESVPEELAELRKAIETGHTETARRHAHTIKGLAAAISAQPCTAAAEYIEHRLKSGELHTAQHALPQLEEHFLDLSEVLQSWLKRPEQRILETAKR